ncbi:MAG: NAD(P)-dependent oxidoreductase [Candidatus Kapaibacteriota bacterium]
MCTSQWPSVILYDSHIPLTEYAQQIDEEMLPFDGRNLTKKFLLESGARALFIRSVTKIDQSIIAGTRLRFIGTCTAGYEHVDVQALRLNGIVFTHAPGSNALPVVEYVLIALHEWSIKQDKKLSDLTIGIIGLGEIGKRVAKMCLALGMKVLASDPPLESYGMQMIQGVQWVGLKQLCASSDCISIHSALTFGALFPTHGLITERYVSSMKKDGLLIQAARGGIVNEQALLHGMNNANLHSAIDVWNKEPMWNQELANHPNTIMATPHIAGYTSAARKRGIDMIVEAYCKQMDAPFISQCAEHEGISFLDESAVQTIKQRRFSEDRILWLQGKNSEAEIFDAGRKTFMFDEETLSEIVSA